MHNICRYSLYSTTDAVCRDTIRNPSELGGIHDPTWKWPYKTLYVKSNDTIWQYDVYVSNDTIIDSLFLNGYYVKFKTNKWFRKYENGDYEYCRFWKCKPSLLFQKYNNTYFHAQYEMRSRSFRRYNSEGVLIESLIFIGSINISKSYEESFY